MHAWNGAWGATACALLGCNAIFGLDPVTQGDPTGDAGLPDAGPISDQILSVSPAPDQVGVEPDAPIEVRFARPMDPATIDAGSLQLFADGEMVAVDQVSYDADTRTAALIPSRRLDLLERFTASASGAITELGGAPLDEYGWEFEIRDGRWEPATPIGPPEVTGTLSPRLAVEPGGAAMAIWTEGASLWSSRWDGAWGAAAPVGPATLAIELGASTAGFVALYRVTSGGGNQFWTVSHDGTGWSSPIPVTGQSPAVQLAAMAVGVAGDAVAPYLDTAQLNECQVSVLERGWVGESFAACDAFDDTTWPAAATVGPSGDALIALRVRSVPATPYRLHTFTRTGAFGWQPGEVLGASISGASAVAAGAPDGTAVLIWRENQGGRVRVVAGRRTGDGWTVTTLDDPDRSGDASAPDVAISASGHAIAAWIETDAAGAAVWSSRFDPALDAWAPSERLDLGGPLVRVPSVAIDERGRALALWEQGAEGEREIVGARHAGGAWSAPATIDRVGDDLQAPQVEVRPDGGALAVWWQSTGVPQPRAAAFR